MLGIRRREFITLLGGAAVWPLTAGAQQAAVPVIGFINSASPSYFATAGAFRDGLKEMGYVEGQNVAIEYRWAEGHYERLPALVRDLVDRQVAVIFAGGGTDPAKAAQAATTKIPIVFVSAADPVRTGLVASLSRPSANVTGVSLLASVLDAKKLGLLRELVPQASVIGALINPNYPEANIQSEEFKAAASRLGVRSIVLPAGTETDINAVFETLVQQHVDALVVSTDPLFAALRDHLVVLAARHSMPAIYFQREFVAAGGLIAYGPDFADGYRQAGVYVGRVLKGEKPAELPVVQPTKFELVVNLKTAKALGLTVPSTLYALANELIE
jgi:putative ABC transport system substrate-binding protein